MVFKYKHCFSPGMCKIWTCGCSNIRIQLFQNETRKDWTQIQAAAFALPGWEGYEPEMGSVQVAPGPRSGLGQFASPHCPADLPASVPDGPCQGFISVPLLERRLSHPRLVEEIWVWAQSACYVLLALHSPWPHSTDHQEARTAPAVRQLQGE